MARSARVEVFAADEFAIVHVMSRTVRRCFLFGEDSLRTLNDGVNDRASIYSQKFRLIA